MLFTVNKSPFSTNHLESALRVAPPDALVLLYEDGVYAAASGTASELVDRALTTHKIYALKADLDARAIAHVKDGVRVIDYDGFVELVEQHHVAPWL